MAIEAALVLIRRSFRHLLSIEFLSATSTCVLYLILTALCAPRYMTAMMPLLTDTYWALVFSYSALYLALHQVPETCTAFFVLLAATFWRRENGERVALLILATCWFASSVAYDMQHTDWGYRIGIRQRRLSVTGRNRWLSREVRSDYYDRDSSTLRVACLLVVLVVSVAVEMRIRTHRPARQRCGNAVGA